MQGIDWIESLRLVENKRILFLVDGEHYPPVVQWTLDRFRALNAEIGGMILLGGTEKIESGAPGLHSTREDYPVYAGGESLEDVLPEISRMLAEESPDLVIDLSDAPVVSSSDRFHIASRVLSAGIPYLGSDFLFKPPAAEKSLPFPSIGIIGTGKRVGKTAVSVTMARVLHDSGVRPAIVAMGRGGPAEPDLITPDQIEATSEYLLDIAAKGVHAASDYWEDAVLAQVPTVGCRRCGGGMAGNPMTSNVLEGVNKLDGLDIDVVLMEGSGPTIPPVKCDVTLLVVSADAPPEDALEYLGEFRVRRADAAVVTFCEEPMANKETIDGLVEGLRAINPGLTIAQTIFRPEPLGAIAGKKVYLTTTSKPQGVAGILEYLEKQYACHVVGYSTNLSDRDTLRNDLEENLHRADLLLTEIKAAGIDVAAGMARNQQKSIVFLQNRPVLTGGDTDDLNRLILSLFRRAESES